MNELIEYEPVKFNLSTDAVKIYYKNNYNIYFKKIPALTIFGVTAAALFPTWLTKKSKAILKKWHRTAKSVNAAVCAAAARHIEKYKTPDCVRTSYIKYKK